MTDRGGGGERDCESKRGGEGASGGEEERRVRMPPMKLWHPRSLEDQCISRFIYYLKVSKLFDLCNSGSYLGSQLESRSLLVLQIKDAAKVGASTHPKQLKQMLETGANTDKVK